MEEKLENAKTNTENGIEAVPEAQSYESHDSHTSNEYQYSYSYTQINEPDNSPLSIGDWVLTLLALLLPCCIGEVLYIVWAFSKNGNVNRRNFCRAALIIMGVIVCIYLVALLVFGGLAVGSGFTEMH